MYLIFEEALWVILTFGSETGLQRQIRQACRPDPSYVVILKVAAINL
jgi:hypothetical protein